MAFQIDYQFLLKGLFFVACIVFLMNISPAVAFAEIATPSEALRINQAYQDAYEDAYDAFMDDMYSIYADTGSEEVVTADLFRIVSECRDFLESCVYLLVVDTVLLSILIGCLCCSIFSKFLRWWR